MDSESENPNDQHQDTEGSSEPTPLTTENLATHDSDAGDSHNSGSSNDDEKQNPADPNLDYIGSQFGSDTATTTEGNLQNDKPMMQRWESNNDDRPAFWPSDEKKNENEQEDATK